MTTKKIILILVGSLLGLFIAGTAYILLVINPNDYKPEIVDQVKSNTGREMIIEGDINWRLLPNIGLTLGKIKINNPEGFPDQPLAELDSAQIDLAFWPLLSKKIEIGMISIEGLSLLLHTKKDGTSNLDIPDDVKKDLADAKNEVHGTKADIPQINNLVVEGLQVVDANIIIEDLSADTRQSIKAINFTLGKLELDKVVPIVLSLTADTGDIKAIVESKGAIRIARDLKKFDLLELKTNISATGETLPEKHLDIKHQMNGYYDLAAQRASLDAMNLSLLGMDLNGRLTAHLTNKPAIDFELNTGDIDLDAILSKLSQTKGNADATPQPVELSWMNSFNMKGLLSANSIKVAKLTVSNIQIPIELKDAILKMSGISAKLYEGKILANTHLDGRKSIPEYSFKSNINNVQALPMVKDLTEKELVSGVAQISLDVKGSGFDDLSIRKNTMGTGSFAFTDGAIHGVNVAELIRNAYAKIKGQTIESTDEPVQTDFASFTGSFILGGGIVKNEDLKLLSPLLRVSGKGSADIVKETVLYQLQTSIVGSLEGQGGQPLTELKNVDIPLKIKGPMADPSISLEMDKILKDSIKKKAKDKLKDKLKGLFGG